MTFARGSSHDAVQRARLGEEKVSVIWSVVGTVDGSPSPDREVATDPGTHRCRWSANQPSKLSLAMHIEALTMDTAGQDRHDGAAEVETLGVCRAEGNQGL